MRKYQSKTFDYSKDFKTTNFRKNPNLYQVGKGEQGVLMVEPYKSEILPFWRFKTPDIAEKSALKIYQMFLDYKSKNDFVGMDMARKFLQMGYTRSRRYANHSSGQKYNLNPQKTNSPEVKKVRRTQVLPQEEDWKTNEKAQSARIFYDFYKKANQDPEYIKLKKNHQQIFG